MNTTLTIKTDAKLRDAAKKTAEEIGVPLTTVVNAMLKQFVLDKEVTFSARLPNQETRKAIKALRAGKGTVYKGDTTEIFDAIVKGR